MAHSENYRRDTKHIARKRLDVQKQNKEKGKDVQTQYKQSTTNATAKKKLAVNKEGEEKEGDYEAT